MLTGILFISNIITAQLTQQKLEDISLEYFGINPIGKSLDSIESELVKSRGVIIDFKREKTDSTLFYFSGYTYSFNPFPFPVKKIQYQLTSSVNKRNPSGIIDTLLTFNIIALTDTSENGKEIVIQEYKKLDKKFKTLFSRNVYLHQKKKKILLYELSSYYEGFFAYPILSSGWGVHYSDRKTYALSIYFRLNLK